MEYYTNNFNFQQVNNNFSGQAMAVVRGSSERPSIYGDVIFTDVPGGVEVYAQVWNLPQYQPAEAGKQPIGPFAFHIHGMGNCQPYNSHNPFTGAGEHWNPDNQPHGNHAGDFPVLISNNGYARMSFFTSRFKVKDVIGKAVIIHENPDDYRTQPAGNAGKRIGCGVIREIAAYRQYNSYY